MEVIFDNISTGQKISTTQAGEVKTLIQDLIEEKGDADSTLGSITSGIAPAPPATPGKKPPGGRVLTSREINRITAGEEGDLKDFMRGQAILLGLKDWDETTKFTNTRPLIMTRRGTLSSWKNIKDRANKGGDFDIDVVKLAEV